jgi:hypothetical protein
MTTITLLPDPPSTADPANFSAEADAFIAALPTLVDEINEFGAGLNSLSTTSTSVSSVLIGPGTKNFTVETGKSYFVGMSLKLAFDATNWMVGEVISYDTGTGALSVNVVKTQGSGTYAAWVITLGFNGVIGTGQLDDLAVTTAKIANANVTQPKLGTNVAGTGPSFAADKTVNQSLSSGVATLAVWANEIFDTNNNFASNRFTPTVAGYYQINASLRCQATNMTSSNVSIYKNGSLYVNGSDNAFATTSNAITHHVSAVVYLNGTTDYVEIYGNVTGSSPIFQFAATGGNGFSGCLVRAA